MSNKDKNLTWSPIGPQLVEHMPSKRTIRLLIAPFMQQQALSKLLDLNTSSRELKVITRWQNADIASGVSDPKVYEELVRRDLPLYINNSIHLKVIVLDDSSCFVGSANVTDKGLGFSQNPNHEVGAWINLKLGDWLELYRIIEESNLVDDSIYDTAIKYRKENLHKSPPLPKIELPISSKKSFTLASLPASRSPEDLLHYCHPKDEDVLCGDPRIIHDLAVYRMDCSIPKEKFLNLLGKHFRTHLFIQAIVDRIRERVNMRFGEVTDWIHNHCNDVPVPYRWEVKAATHTLYDWLAYFFPEIEWSVPGDRSQVIYWKSKSNNK